MLIWFGLQIIAFCVIVASFCLLQAVEIVWFSMDDNPDIHSMELFTSGNFNKVCRASVLTDDRPHRQPFCAL